MRILKLACLLILISHTINSQSIGNGKDGSPSIAGVVNNYAGVLSITASNCNSEIQVSNSTGFAIGDLFIIMQMNGATISQNNDSTYGTISNLNGAGNYEYALVFDIVGNKIYTLAPLMKSYLVSAAVQLIRVPQYANPVIADTLTCLPWNGSTGGVLALDATGTITLNNNVHANGRGFRGGAKGTSAYLGSHVGNYFYTSISDSGANKGEGIASSMLGLKVKGRGAPANGGGGGNNHNGGGGGGANAGCGGNGGYGYQNPIFGPNFIIANGIGAKDNAPLFQLNQLIMGGGGGAGHANNINDNAGGNGGGIIIISANAIDANNNLIESNGTNAADVIIDGAGGGGAGGTVLINCNTYISPAKLYAKGNNSGGVNPQAGTDHGPGGGGGGGVILFNQASLPFNITGIEVTGGYNGLCNTAAHGSSAGCDGQVLFNKQINIPAPQLIYTSRLDTSFCGVANIQLTASAGNNFVWSGATGLSCTTCQSPTLNTTSSGTYIAIVNNSSCLHIDRVNTAPVVNFSINPTCINQPAFALSSGIPSGGTYAGNGISTNIFSPAGAGVGNHMLIYTYSDNNGCSSADSALMTVFDSPQFQITTPPAVCANHSSFVLNLVTPGGGAYTGTGTSNNIFNPSQAVGSNTITYNYTDTNGCSNDTSFTQIVHALPLVTLASFNSVCANATPLQLAGGLPLGGNYNGNGVSSNTFFPMQVSAGYNTIVYSYTDTNGCVASDSSTIKVLQVKSLTAIAADTICTGMQTVLTATGSTNVQWWPGTGINCTTCTTAIASPSTTTTYVLSSSDSCTVNDTIIIEVIPQVIVHLGNDTAICLGEEMQLDPISNYNSFSWSSNPYIACTNCGEQWISPLQSSTYTVTVTNGYCSSSDKIHVEVIEVKAEAMTNLSLIVAGEMVELSASGANAYRWEPADVVLSDKAQITTARPLQSTWFTVTGTIGRCSDTASIFVEVYDSNDGLFIPNAFSPNGDGQNEIFAAIKAGDYLFYNLSIFNRWGKKIFETSDLQKGWDGSYDGELCQAGEYYYQVYLKTARNIQNKSGKVLLLR
ncbi:MAG: gliding motility-associated C-terminal domain-containing protein [Bacteroidetes bacterium]|nr:gliding motility-associated C-terminal domain-containing protein [Bacteroidota bacterium]